MEAIRFVILLAVLAQGWAVPASVKSDRKEDIVVIDISRRNKDGDGSKKSSETPKQVQPEDSSSNDKILEEIRRIQDQLDQQQELQQSVLMNSGLLQKLLTPQEGARQGVDMSAGRPVEVFVGSEVPRQTVGVVISGQGAAVPIQNTTVPDNTTTPVQNTTAPVLVPVQNTTTPVLVPVQNTTVPVQNATVPVVCVNTSLPATGVAVNVTPKVPVVLPQFVLPVLAPVTPLPATLPTQAPYYQQSYYQPVQQQTYQQSYSYQQPNYYGYQTAAAPRSTHSMCNPLLWKLYFLKSLFYPKYC